MKTGPNHAPKVHELVETQTMTIPLIHLYAGFAMCSDGKTTMRVPLTDEQVVQLASDFAEQAAKILRWESRHEQSSKDRPDAGSGDLRSAGLRGRGK